MIYHFINITIHFALFNLISRHILYKHSSNARYFRVHISSLQCAFTFVDKTCLHKGQLKAREL